MEVENFWLSSLHQLGKIVVSSGWTIGEDVTNQHNVKVSLANPEIVWAGAGMHKAPDLFLFVSKDGGNSFSPVNVYDEVEMGYISGLATHPVNPNEAFAMFSFNGAPKILRTMDLGKTWKDISGFGTGTVSSNGFPNVAVNCLMVMPFDTSWIWVGTEIGLFESRDNGNTWAYANNGLPAVSIWQIKTADDEVVVATHGRGIWSTIIPGSSLNVKNIEPEEIALNIYPIPVRDFLNFQFNNDYEGTMQLEIIAMTGKPVYRKSLEKSKGQYSDRISLQNIPAGNYTFTLQWGNSKVAKKIQVRRN